MPYEIYLSNEAVKILSKLESSDESRIRAKLRDLERESVRHGKQLSNLNLFSLRVGSFRVIYELEESNKRIYVVTIGRRKNVYDR